MIKLNVKKAGNAHILSNHDPLSSNNNQDMVGRTP